MFVDSCLMCLQVKAAENQLEEEYESKQVLVREKKELERKLAVLGEQQPERNRGL
jgi:hypothetical protein